MPYGLRLRRRRNLLRYNVCETALIFLFWTLLGTETQNSKKFTKVSYVIQSRTGCNVLHILVKTVGYRSTAMVSPFGAEGKGSQALFIGSVPENNGLRRGL